MEDEDIYDFYDEDHSKICSLSRSHDQSDLDLLKKRSKESRYFCPECKRSAYDASMLCSAEAL